MSDWSDDVDAESFTEQMRERLIVTHASMDVWETDFLAALATHDVGNSLDKPPTI